MSRKIAVITGSRADYGHLYPVIIRIMKDPTLRLQLVVTGMHLSREFGYTVKNIIRDALPITAQAKMLLPYDTEEAIAISMGRGMIKFAELYTRLKPDIVVVLGDRFEIHAAVSAAIPFKIPVAHIHGGEATEGLIDDPIRHSITKMSHLHFASNQRYRKRIIQMGERPKNVFCFGAPGLDNIKILKLMGRKELCSELKIPAGKTIGVVTYHPVTLERGTDRGNIKELLKALLSEKDVFWVLTSTNADTGGKIITKSIKEFVGKRAGTSKLFLSLGQRLYLSLLKNADIMVGNSSSGIIEAPSFGLPVVNIGDRQKNRIRAKNVIDVSSCKHNLIENAIGKALSKGFRASLRNLRNPYGDGNASDRIVRVLRTIKITESLIKKEFREI